MTQEVQLVNPVAHQFGAFIFGNSLNCERVVEQDSAKGEHIVICGAGPSLADEAHKHCRRGFDQLWGCNSALTWLIDNGYKPTHGYTIDQTAHMVGEWYDAPDVKYLVASSVHPHLTEWLLEHDRHLTFFHNFVGLQGEPVAYGACEACQLLHSPGAELEPCHQCGGELEVRLMPYEDWTYMTLYPATARTGSGLNSVSRAVDLAIFMGARKVTVLGADCALRIKSRPAGAFGSAEHIRWLKEDAVMHADGSDPLRSGATAVTMGAEIVTPRNALCRWLIRHGIKLPILYRTRYWETKPDMCITAVFLAEMAEYYGRRLRLVGDTLPNALVGKSREYLERLPSIVDRQGNVAHFAPPKTPYGLT